MKYIVYLKLSFLILEYVFRTNKQVCHRSFFVGFFLSKRSLHGFIIFG